jgi:hypothetical protein
MNETVRFLVFVRADRFPWALHQSCTTLDEAVATADAVVAQDVADRAVVMEVGSVDAMPMFTWKYRALSKKS